MDENILVAAEALVQSEIDAGIRRATQQLTQQPKDFDGCCFDCGCEIPEGRIKFGAVTCINCQEIRERRQKLYR